MGSAIALKDEEPVGSSSEEGFCGSLEDVAAEEMQLATVLQALSDPIRLKIVQCLADDCEWTCGSFDLPIAKSTTSHHLRVLGEAGIVARRVDGKCRLIKLRRTVMDERFPGLLDAVLGAATPV